MSESSLPVRLGGYFHAIRKETSSFYGSVTAVILFVGAFLVQPLLRLFPALAEWGALASGFLVVLAAICFFLAAFSLYDRQRKELEAARVLSTKTKLTTQGRERIAIAIGFGETIISDMQGKYHSDSGVVDAEFRARIDGWTRNVKQLVFDLLGTEKVAMLTNQTGLTNLPYGSSPAAADETKIAVINRRLKEILDKDEA